MRPLAGWPSRLALREAGDHGYQRQTWNGATMRDDDLRRHVAAELSWDPQVDSEAIEVSAAGCGGRLVCARVTQVNDRIRIESRPELTVSPAARVSPCCSGSCGRPGSGC